MNNNEITIAGCLTSNFIFSHEICGERFFSCTLSAERESGTKDNLPIIISDRLIDIERTYDRPICIKGQIRTYNRWEGEKRRLILYVFVTEVEDVCGINKINEVILGGTICKEPTLRVTPQDRMITDVMLDVKRNYEKSDHIPCITWGRSAVFVSQQKPGTYVQLVGRLQSREYIKVFPDRSETRTAYEVSVNWLEVLREVGNG